ncbi:MAG TPA: hypothetical protein VNF99_12375 [Stellaceae bacterium]|nr:hypothetical protein [Stellaceae bacterium]
MSIEDDEIKIDSIATKLRLNAEKCERLKKEVANRKHHKEFGVSNQTLDEELSKALAHVEARITELEAELDDAIKIAGQPEAKLG